MKYDDIIDIPRYIDPARQSMSMHDRAAQFMPFKSLKGYDDMVSERDRSMKNMPWENVEYENEDDII